MANWFLFTSPHSSSGTINHQTFTDNCRVTSPPVLISDAVYGTLNNPSDGVSLEVEAIYSTLFGPSYTFTSIWSEKVGTGKKVLYGSDWRGSTTLTYTYQRNYCGNLIRSIDPITNENILAKGIEPETTTVFGKFRKNAATINYPIQYGGVDIPVSFSFGNQSFDHMVFPAWSTGYSGWNYYYNGNQSGGAMGFSNNKSSFAGYRESDFGDNENVLTWFTTAYNTTTIADAFADSDINFGNTPQEVPVFFANWLNDNFTQIFENDYIFKNVDGEIVAQITGAPPVKKVNLIYNGVNASISMTGINDVIYSTSWVVYPPEGMTMTGLRASGGRVIGIGESDVSWIGQILTEYFSPYKPVEETFDIDLYRNSAEPNRVLKGDYLELVETLSGALREECSLISPSIIIQYQRVPDFNYVYIPIFDRYYFVKNITSVRKTLWRIDLQCDVLMTYNVGIGNLSAVIDRQENSYNPELVDEDIPTEKENTYSYLEFSTTPFSNQLSGATVHNYLLTVVGSGQRQSKNREEKEETKNGVNESTVADTTGRISGCDEYELAVCDDKNAS